MTKIPFLLKDLSIQKIPGFPRGLAVYTKLASHINIIFGPNGSGKSSTARIIQKLIWQKETDGLQVESSVDLDHKHWEIKIDSDKIIVQSDGTNADILRLLPTEDVSGRYMLALHELVKEDDQSLAQQIVNESIGGFNLELAQRNLGYADNIKNKGISEYKNFEITNNRLREIEQNQRNLIKEEEKLEQLVTTKLEAVEANRLAGLYEKVVEWLEAKIKFEQVSEKYKSFPVVLEKINGDEFIAIEELEDELGVADDLIEQAVKGIEENKEILAALKLPESGVDDKILNELCQRVDELLVQEGQIRTTENEIAGLRSKQKETLKTIGDDLNPAGWDHIQLEEVNGLEEFLLEAHQTMSEKHFLEAEISELQKEIEENRGPEIKVLDKGIDSLTYWLQEQSATTSTFSIPIWWIIVLSVTGVLAALIPFYFGLLAPWLEIGMVVLVGLLMIFYSGRTVADKNIDIRKQDYIKTGLSIPEQWDIEGVKNKLKTLIDELKDAEWKNKIQQKITIPLKGLETLEGRLLEIKQKRLEWLNEIAAVPGIPEDKLKNYDGLYWFLIHVKEWKAYFIEMESLSAQKSNVARDLSENITIINRLLNESNGDIITNGFSAKAIYQKLQKDENKRRETVAEIRREGFIKIDKTNQRIRTQQKLRDIYNKLNIEVGNKVEIAKIIEQLADCRNVKQKYQVAEGLLKNKFDLMRSYSLYEPNKAAIESLTLDQATDKKNDLLDQAEKLTEINRNITTIETNIGHVRKGHTLEDALAEKDAKLNDLERLYENNLSSITGKLLIDQLKEQTREQNRPAVFKRANDLFSNITKGRYRLILEEGAAVSFKAYDTISKLGQNLSELSTGTRIQLLISVRLAFIETQEPLIQLPILADELLANSDDTRALAIIEALVEISKEGRQVFYFTAQADEVVKWKNFLKSEKEDFYNIFELTGKENEIVEFTGYPDNSASFTFLNSIPDPGKLNHTDYGKLLSVPPFNILLDKPEHLHLWYLLEDTMLLKNCLMMGVKFWGQLDGFMKYNGKVEGINELTLSLIRDKIQLLEYFQELYRKGRCLPINQEILVASGAVSPAYKDRVLLKLKSLAGNPEDLLAALKHKEITGFQKDRIMDLENYLIEKGYINKEPILKIEDILVRVQAFSSNKDIDIAVAESFIKGILGYPFQVAGDLAVSTIS